MWRVSVNDLRKATKKRVRKNSKKVIGVKKK